MKVFLTSTLLFWSFLCLAQPGSPDTPTPIDGGVLALAAAGVGYGFKKIKENKRHA
ncbi:MAG: hypothetical protein HWD92_02485 [Flavobacteriia bacterium]|nr:hypothetical protein [Flavobacteriia bacterium]